MKPATSRDAKSFDLIVSFLAPGLNGSKVLRDLAYVGLGSFLEVCPMRVARSRNLARYSRSEPFNLLCCLTVEGAI